MVPRRSFFRLLTVADTPFRTGRLMKHIVPILTAFLLIGSADAQRVDLDRSGLLYSIGTVERVRFGSAMIDLGESHALSVAPPYNKVAVFRVTREQYIPVGILQTEATYETFSQLRPSSSVKPLAGDVVMFVRELSDVKTPERFHREFLRNQILKRRTETGYSSIRRISTADVLREYSLMYREWTQSKANVVGFLNGDSYRGREQDLSELLQYIEMIRDDFRQGHNSLSAAGQSWQRTVPLLFGRTVMAQHAASQPEDADDPTVTPRRADRDIQRAVDETFFDRTGEERNLLSYLTATLLERPRQGEDVWLRYRLQQSQFPELGQEEVIVSLMQRMLLELNGEN